MGQRDGYFIPRGAPRSHRAGAGGCSRGSRLPMGEGGQDPWGTPGSHGGSGQALGLPLITSPHWTYSHRNDHSRAGESGGSPWTIGFRQNEPPRPLPRLPSVTDSVGCHLPPVIRGLIDRTARTPCSLPGHRPDPHDDVPRGTAWVGWSTPGCPHERCSTWNRSGRSEQGLLCGNSVSSGEPLRAGLPLVEHLVPEARSDELPRFQAHLSHPVGWPAGPVAILLGGSRGLRDDQPSPLAQERRGALGDHGGAPKDRATTPSNVPRYVRIAARTPRPALVDRRPGPRGHRRRTAR